MHKLTIKANVNPFVVDTQWGIPVKYNRVRVSKLLFTPSSNVNNSIEFKIDTGGRFDRNIEIATGKPFFYIQPVMQAASVGVVNMSNGNDWDYCECEPKYLTDFTMKFYEDTTLISSAYLAANNIYIELTFE